MAVGTTVEIYSLSDPDTGDVRYIGKARSAANRLKTHIRDSRRRKTPLYEWLTGLLAQGKIPALRVLETCDETVWPERETVIIAEHRGRFSNLLNVANGGNEPLCSKEVRAENARNVTKIRTSDSRKAEIYRLKKMLGDSLRRGFVREDTKELLRYAARRDPENFGLWANI